MKDNATYTNLVCPDCGNTEQDKFHEIIDFGEGIEEVKFACKKCFEWFIMTYDELEIIEDE